ncbi:hypothetical protein FOA22_24595 [Heyndrickxia oleronia]|uniref:S26 family signal peptidase n=1 Tax=Heyndrickxia oleronia TaxID=38875 RepID=UPI0033387EAD
MNRLTLLFMLLILLIGCSKITVAQTVTDEVTTPKLEIINNINSEMITFHNMSDSMDRGNHELSDEVVVVNTKIEKSKITRGSVVLLKNIDGEKVITRILGVPKEVIYVQDGQVYINSKELDTFYGKVHRLGYSQEEYFESMDKNKIFYNKEEMEKLFKQNIKKITLGKNDFFVSGDDWLRSDQMKIKTEDIIGIVIGYKNKN